MGNSLLPPPRRQHTISRVVLRRFTQRGEFVVYDRDHGSSRRKGPSTVFCEYLDRHDPWGAEDRWNLVERKMRRVYDLIDARTVLDDDSAVATLRALVAMHWIRTPAFREPHERIRRDVALRSITRLDEQPGLLRHGMRQVSNLVPGGPEGLAWFNRRLHDQVWKSSADEMLSGSIARLYEGALRMFADFEIKVGYSEGSDFLIGDAPVIVRKPGHDGAGLHQGVALGDANEIAMPISPHVIIAFSKKRTILSLTDEDVDRYNLLQAHTFQRWIAWQPGGASAECMAEALGRRDRESRTGTRRPLRTIDDA